MAIRVLRAPVWKSWFTQEVRSLRGIQVMETHEVEAARNHQHHVFWLVGDPAVTSLPPVSSTPEHPVVYYDTKNKFPSPAASQNTIAHAFAVIGSG